MYEKFISLGAQVDRRLNKQGRPNIPPNPGPGVERSISLKGLGANVTRPIAAGRSAISGNSQPNYTSLVPELVDLMMYCFMFSYVIFKIFNNLLFYQFTEWTK